MAFLLRPLVKHSRLNKLFQTSDVGAPLVILFIFFQRRFIERFASSGVNITAALGPHPKSLSLRARDFKTLLPFSLPFQEASHVSIHLSPA